MAAKVGSTTEKTTSCYTITLKDKDGNVPTLDSLVLTLKTDLGTVINLRDHQNVLNANGVTITNGVINWDMTQLDNAIVDGASNPETHIFTFEAIWNSGAGRMNWERQYSVTDLTEVT